MVVVAVCDDDGGLVSGVMMGKCTAATTDVPCYCSTMPPFLPAAGHLYACHYHLQNIALLPMKTTLAPFGMQLHIPTCTHGSNSIARAK